MVAVPASATGSDSGFAMAVAWPIAMPRRRMRGTVITLPPTPRNAAIQPMTSPDNAVPMEEGAARPSAGCDRNMGQAEPLTRIPPMRQKQRSRPTETEQDGAVSP